MNCAGAGENGGKVDGHEHDVVMPGFRFHPTEEELLQFYLRRKVEGRRFNVDLIACLDLYRYDPWELPSFATIGEKEWFFYVPRDRKYRNGDRPNRVTASGYWKATGADRMVRGEGSRPIGLKKTLVFYYGKAPKGVRTGWIMNEYRLPHEDTVRCNKNKLEISLCRVYKRTGVQDQQTLPRGHSAKSSSSRLPGSSRRHGTDENEELVMPIDLQGLAGKNSPSSALYDQRHEEGIPRAFFGNGATAPAAVAHLPKLEASGVTDAGPSTAPLSSTATGDHKDSAPALLSHSKQAGADLVPVWRLLSSLSSCMPPAATVEDLINNRDDAVGFHLSHGTTWANHLFPLLSQFPSPAPPPATAETPAMDRVWDQYHQLHPIPETEMINFK